jgi:16S rRNA C967 or C1407 C5-methylase (RsmB/RsmF family)
MSYKRNKLVEKILNRYKDIIPEYDFFKEVVFHRPLKSIKINNIVYDEKEILSLLKERTALHKIDWCSHAYYTEGNYKLGRSVYHELGLFYIQNITSLLPPLILNPKEDDITLDVAAAPGGKTIHMAQIMNNQGIIYANDKDPRRIKQLIYNITKFSVTNTVVTNIDARLYPSIDRYSKVLLDAPCTNESLIYKMNTRTLEMLLSQRIYRKYHVLQKQIIKRLSMLLDKESLLLYSVCTYAPEECEYVVESAINYGFEPIKLNAVPLKCCKGIDEWIINGRKIRFDSSVKRCIRIYPHLNYNKYHGSTGYIFISLLRRC